MQTQGGCPRNVEVIVRIGSREVVTLNHRFSGDSLEIEQQTECFKDRIGQVILTGACSRFDAALRRPCCCGRLIHRKGTRTVTLMSQSGEIRFEHTRYRCPECHCCRTPADRRVRCGNHHGTSRSYGGRKIWRRSPPPWFNWPANVVIGKPTKMCSRG